MAQKFQSAFFGKKNMKIPFPRNVRQLDSVTERHLESKFLYDLNEISDRWTEESSQAALNDNPQRAHYIHGQIQRMYEEAGSKS